MIRPLFFLLALAVSVRGQTLDDLRVHLVAVEGYSSTPYRDNRGILHIGIGHRIQPGELLYVKMPSDVIERTFRRDVEIARRAARTHIISFDSQPYSVRVLLISLSYNVGASGLSSFVRFRAAIDRRDYRAAAHHLMDSRWATQLPSRAALYVQTLNRQT